jgi:hypothetical protein
MEQPSTVKNIRSAIGPLKNDSGKITYDNQEMAEILNSFFASVYTKENLTDLPEKNTVGG